MLQYLECSISGVPSVGDLQWQHVYFVKDRNGMVLEGCVDSLTFVVDISRLGVLVQDTISLPGAVHSGTVDVRPGSGRRPNSAVARWVYWTNGRTRPR